jgi:cell division protein FtsW
MVKSAEKNKNELSPNPKAERGRMDFMLLFIILVLFVAGLFTMFSASSAANMMNGKVFDPAIKQAILGCAGLFLMIVIGYSDYRKLKSVSGLLYLAIEALMFIVPLIGMASHGAKRQIDLKIFSFQPSEFSKYIMIIMLAARFSVRKREKIDTWSELITSFIIIGIPVTGCFLQSHGSAAAIHAAVGFCMLIATGIGLEKLGVKRVLLLALVAVLLIAVVFAVTGAYRMQRITSFINDIVGGDDDSQGIGWQAKQSIYAVGSGGLFGLGLSKSRQKYSYLPEAENDYIFAILCEEGGFVGGLAVVILFCALVWRGIVIAIKCRDKFGSYIAFGISTLIGIQACLSMCVVLKLAPPTGIQLPLFSSGGTSLMITLVGFGILLSISRYSNLNEK